MITTSMLYLSINIHLGKTGILFPSTVQYASEVIFLKRITHCLSFPAVLD